MRPNPNWLAFHSYLRYGELVVVDLTQILALSPNHQGGTILHLPGTTLQVEGEPDIVQAQIDTAWACKA